jgi:hypothetical protein
VNVYPPEKDALIPGLQFLGIVLKVLKIICLKLLKFGVVSGSFE